MLTNRCIMMQAESDRASFITFTSVHEFTVPIMQVLQGKNIWTKSSVLPLQFSGSGTADIIYLLLLFCFLDPLIMLCNRFQGKTKKELLSSLFD